MVVEPKDGYGERNPELVQQMPRRQFKGINNLRVGQQLHAQGPNGPRAITVVAMAGDMVAGLERRLKDEPRDPAGWEMLMRSRVSMGQMDLARQAYRDARAAYAGDESQQARFRQAAASMGISGL